ncbi:hypothetical protein T265_12053 [Opisthorchis viverrini]|uniref:Uncharacterized protein n=1 Tax=Opisthorchis viverrini TaxID=6198 RepID=A0A074YWF4_OPIVI|nr:hypothetical protein T265_12053 [Opisthorchis viverrini]KER19013.1 hypothetical protein T265_12053 [Opisthorchis viverrini]
MHFNTTAHQPAAQRNNHVKQSRAIMPPRLNHVRFHHVPEKGQIGTQKVHTHSVAKALRTQAHRRPSMINRDKGTTARRPVWDNGQMNTPHKDNAPPGRPNVHFKTTNTSQHFMTSILSLLSGADGRVRSPSRVQISIVQKQHKDNQETHIKPISPFKEVRV